jgi:diguanylate cyclase (GGDEF)-like protein/PAS domain S-box-containing protein
MRLAQGLAELAKVQLRLDDESLRRQDSEALFDRVFSAMADAVVLVDPRGEISRANQAAIRLTGRALEELVGLRPKDIFGPGVPTTPWELFRLAPGGTVESIDAYIHATGDRALPVGVSCAAIQDSNGKVVGAVYAARDMSRRKEAEEQREVQLRLTQILARAQTVAEVFTHVLQAVGESFGWQVAAAWLPDPGNLTLSCQHLWRSEALALTERPGTRLLRECGDTVSRVWQSGEVEWREGLEEDLSARWTNARLSCGLYLPLEDGGKVLGVIELLGDAREPMRDAVVELLAGMAKQIGGFIERRHARESRDKMELFQSAFENAPAGMALFGVEGDSRGRILQVNEALCNYLDTPAEEILARGLEDLTYPNDRDAHVASMEALSAGELSTSSLETRYVRSTGELLTGILHCSLLRDGIGKPIYVIGQLQDITEAKRLQHELAEKALHDPLTKLPNRVLFMELLGRALSQGKRQDTSAAVIFADLDNFKVINDSLGHGAGDELLVGVAKRLAQIIRPSDTVSRFGGDEFTILCQDLKGDEDLDAITRRIKNEMAAPFDVQGRQVVLTLSLGIAASGRGESPEELLRDADAAMYSAKAGGRARHAIFDHSMRRRAVKRLETEQALRRAIDNEELRLAYQPQVNLETGDVFGFEALLRWHDPERGLTPPLDFIPLAEETGLIIPIGEWVLTAACHQAKIWRDAQPENPLKMSVNISVRQLADPSFPATVRRVLDEAGVQPDDIWLEVTESALIQEENENGSIFEALHNLDGLGMRLAIDDFGVGTSSLNRFRELPPVAAVKIDRLFIQSLHTHHRDRRIAAAAIALANALDAATVAEGVETSDQASMLREMGCELAQGFYFAAPEPAVEFEALMGPGKSRTYSMA